MNTSKLSWGDTEPSEFTTVPASVELLIPALLKFTENITWFWVLNMFFYTGHNFSSADRSRLNVESCEMYVGNFAGWEKAGGRCGLIYLMVMCTGNTHDIKS